MEHNIKAIFFDVDGTLLSPEQNDVPQSTRLALYKLRLKGVKTVVATGRPLSLFKKAGALSPGFS